MTDNEKRAHDLAVVTVPVLYDMQKYNAISNKDNSVKIDLYDEYLRSYETLLDAFNRDFPNGK